MQILIAPTCRTYRRYATVLRSALGTAVRILDAFHVVRLGFAAVDAVRCRIQRDQTATAAAVRSVSSRVSARRGCSGTASCRARRGEPRGWRGLCGLDEAGAFEVPPDTQVVLSMDDTVTTGRPRPFFDGSTVYCLAVSG